MGALIHAPNTINGRVNHNNLEIFLQAVINNNLAQLEKALHTRMCLRAVSQWVPHNVV